MLDQSHPTVSRPALLVVVTDQVLVVRIWVRREVSLDEISRFVGGEAKHDVNSIDVARVESDRVTRFGSSIAELKEVVGHLRRSRHLTRS